MNPPKPLTPHPHPVLWMVLAVVWLAWISRPDAATANDVTRLTETIERQAAQLDRQTKQLAAVQRSLHAEELYLTVLQGRIDAIDCDLYGLICPDSERWPTKLQPRSTRSHTRSPITSKDRLDWPALAQCEASGNPRAVSASGKYRGLYQFDLTTWRSVGGHGDPINATPAEQTRRAQLLYAHRGRAPWPVCGRLL